MGYTTDFTGQFNLNRPLTPEQAAYLKAFANTRRMKRNSRTLNRLLQTGALSDPIREAVGLPIGPHGAYFVGGRGFAGQEEDPSISQYNASVGSQPGLWCQWVPNEDGTAIVWDGGEKFYNYADWIVYIIKHFLSRWDHVLNGEVRYQGEDPSDQGEIEIVNNTVKMVAYLYPVV